jgi:hypothetical protein
MNTDELIADLGSRLTPVRPLQSPARRTVAWTGVALVAVGAGLLLFRPRPDIAERLTQLDFVWTLAVAGLVGCLAAAAALTLAVPGAERSSALRSATWLLILMWGLGLGAAALQEGSGILSDPHWPACFVRVMAVGLVPAAALGLMIRRAAALRPGLAGMLAGMAAMAMATIAVQIVCPIDAAGHSLSGHFAPVMMVAPIGALVGQRSLGQSRPSQ